MYCRMKVLSMGMGSMSNLSCWHWAHLRCFSLSRWVMISMTVRMVRPWLRRRCGMRSRILANVAWLWMP